MKQVVPIRSAPRIRWREIRTRILPPMVWLLVLGIVVQLWRVHVSIVDLESHPPLLTQMEAATDPQGALERVPIIEGPIIEAMIPRNTLR